MDNIVIKDSNYNKEIVRQMVERKIQYIIDNTDNIVGNVLNMVGLNSSATCGLITKKVDSLINKHIDQVNGYMEFLIESSFTDEHTSIEQALANANAIINEFISKEISKKTNFPMGVVEISLPLLLGDLI